MNLWLDETLPPDSYIAFRGKLTLRGPDAVDFSLAGAAEFVVWLDGRLLAEGPARFPAGHPEFLSVAADLAAGPHLLAVVVHHVGIETRLLPATPPFLDCTARTSAGEPLPITWTCRRLEGYHAQVRRINPCLGWIEWCDTRRDSPEWHLPGFDEADWAVPVPAEPDVRPAPPTIAPVRQLCHSLAPAASGTLIELFGYDRDDPAARFFLRTLQTASEDPPPAPWPLPPQGVWRRYDLGRVRLGRPRFTLDLPPGAVVEFACSETLSGGRVLPWITLSTGPSCLLNHYVARGGPQEFFPLASQGGRYLEAHVLAAPEHVHFLGEQYIERTYHGEPEGTFACSDPALDVLWRVGVETYRACAEDAIVDTPTRERGQWTGDTVNVGLEVAAAAYADLRLARRCLVQSAVCARDDGLIAGLCPGTPEMISSYAARWVDACLRYQELTGDQSLLEQLYPAAVRNLDIFERHLGPEGLSNDLAWNFVDWGYASDRAGMAGALFALGALQSMQRWCRTLGRAAEAVRYGARAGSVRDLVAAWLGDTLRGSAGWAGIGYHCAALALALGFFDGTGSEPACVAFLKGHLQDCYPNSPDAPRLSDPGVQSSRVITPFFAHFAFPPLIERGEMDFVLDQYRVCWGAMVAAGATTFWEVFDPRWSHCHQWSACPTWQLSRYVLGLHPRFDRGRGHFDLRLCPGSLTSARGTLPLPESAAQVEINWRRTPEGIRYRLSCPEPLQIRRSGSDETLLVQTPQEILLG